MAHHQGEREKNENVTAYLRSAWNKNTGSRSGLGSEIGLLGDFPLKRASTDNYDFESEPGNPPLL
jgi:hypothetical protein